MNEEPLITGEKADRDPETGRFLPNNHANDDGRPKGRFSITSQIIKRLEDNPDQANEVIEWLLKNRKDLVWNKIDPNPPTDLNLSGEVNLPVRIIEVIKPEDNPDEPNSIQTIP